MATVVQPTRSEFPLTESQPDQQRFATLLRQVVAGRNMKVKEVAAHIGVTPGAVSQWRSGQSDPTPTNIRGLADVLGFPAAKFYAALAGEDEDAVRLSDQGGRSAVPPWAHDLGGLSAETVSAIRLLIEADKWQREQLEIGNSD